MKLLFALINIARPLRHVLLNSDDLLALGQGM
jgi:hypothetical protein